MASLSPLLTCPADIFYLFLQPLSSADLYSLCLVCKTLRTLAEPKLYLHIRLIWLDPEDASTTPQIPPIIPLLRSILSRYELGAYVQYLDLGGQPTVRCTGRRATIPVTTMCIANLAELIAFIEGVQDRIAYANLWKSELRNGSMDAFVALLLSLLPNLKQLHITTRFAAETRIIGDVLRSALYDTGPVNKWLPSFRDLQEVSFWMDLDTSRPMAMRNTDDMLPLFRLPSVQRLLVCIENPIAFVWPLDQVPQATLLTSLELKGTSIREDHLGTLLLATPSLKRLHWNWFYRPDPKGTSKFGSRVINLDKIIAAISHVRNTLEELAIFASVSHLSSLPVISTRGSLGQIVGFDALKRFEAPVPFLLGFSIAEAWLLESSLPRNLEILTISDDLCMIEEYEWCEMGAIILLEKLLSLLRDYKSYTPHLQAFGLELRWTDDDWGPKMRRQLTDTCAIAGLRLLINKLHEDVYFATNPASH